MARKPNARQRLRLLSEKFEPLLQAAFLAAIDDLRSNAQITRIAERLERGDIDGALRALNVDAVAFRLFEEGVREAFVGGGIAATAALPILREPNGARLVARFDARSPGAEQFMRELSGRNVQVVEDVLLAARQHMTQGLIYGRNPRSVALDIVGRVDRSTGRRTGGILGLTSKQEEYVTTARQDLLSGDPDRLRHYLTLKRRDRRRQFEKAVEDAIRDAKPIPLHLIDRMIGKLSDSYLLLRGETITRTETIGALNASHRDTFDQLVASGNVQANQVRKIWRATKDNRTRDSHRNLDSESVGINELFSNGLQYPCDPSGSAREVINCRCAVDYRIEYFTNLA
ncbi:phage minor head protein [Limoniibacter endophyticus]|uniref:Phage head morphogenesis domain-containing protein n=1 Tax=Limoniibacter endophyticus TaxID=1565040 RepID=A0A8J3DQ71_9HYPH|nr:phage minor head protein [Limoniibacter endophyticus]GHC79402.1 hypothetical protein GCM10010136_31910 [Limoniibacter endophyticus]